MKEPATCAECGVEISQAASFGLCPRCLLYQGDNIGTEAAATSIQAAIDGGALVRIEAGVAIGRYKLLERIGEGGMGEVWMAEQREPVRRKVALKIIKLGMDTKQVVARFEAERQALAVMDHPHIARVLDGGATSDRDAPTS